MVISVMRRRETAAQNHQTKEAKMADMTVKLYDVWEDAGNLLSACERIIGMTPEKRDIVVGGHDMKMEQFVPKYNDENLFLMDFTKRRKVGPGRASRKSITQGFKVEDDEGFGEFTAALYDPAAKKILVQYSQYGPRYGNIAKYISDLSDGGVFRFTATVKADVQAELDTKGYANSISFSVPFLQNEPSSAHGKAGALMDEIGQAIVNTGIEGVGEVMITMKRKGTRKKIENYEGLFKSLLRSKSPLSKNNFNADDEPLATSAKATMSSAPDEPVELIDFMDAQETIKLYGGLDYDAETRLYPLLGGTGRGQRLLAAYRTWKTGKVIYS